MDNNLDFNNLVEGLGGDKEEMAPIAEEPSKELVNGQISCDLCEFVTNKSGKDHPRAIRNHIRKKHPKEFAEIYKNADKKKEIHLEYAPPYVEQIVDHLEGATDEDVREILLNDLDLFRCKFEDKIPFNWDYSAGSSTQHLRRKKALFLRVLNDQAGTEAIFKLLTIGCSGVERLTYSTGVADLNGYSSDVAAQKDEIVPILKTMVDTGQISVAALSPEMRLMMIMASTGIERLEKNRLARSAPLEETAENEDWQ